MLELNILKELKEAIVFETAYMYSTANISQGQKNKLVDAVTCVWNRGFQRAGHVEHFKELCISEEEVKRAAERWTSNKQKTAISSQ